MQVSATSSAPASVPTAAHPSGSHSVYAITVNRTAEMVAAGHTASFRLTAWTKNGHPAAHQPVTIYIGTMVPLSGMPPTRWLASSTSAAARYIRSYSHETNSRGQVRVVLSAQPAKTMEMVGVKIGNLSTYRPSTMAALGSLDAWWTTPTTSPTAPIGDSVTVRPFVTKASPGASIPISVTVNSSTGPIANARVQFIPKHSSSMMGAMSNSGGYTRMTNRVGQVVWRAMAGSGARDMPIRIVVTTGASMNRVAGGMNTEIVVP
ncbi:hypothetical protein [Sulfobacillus harzensis]|uniref:Uncharacterized protein n=1 Tax=Sulfobacillus harzensis TaxID=2729629 RepID=A0A7Y0Q4N3_9FIRM|nr:hypothetical protein [Sulfobacillus harzensis]NMP24590.1 hypothetical protein [Sulfobacillus harzensis]